MLRSVQLFCGALLVWLAGQAVSSGQGYPSLNVNPERLQQARQTEQRALAANDSLLLAEAWYLYGKTYVFAGDYRSSQSYFLNSLQILEPRGDSFELSRLYVRLSENESKQAHLKESINYARLALKVAERIRSKLALMRAYGALGGVYENLRDRTSTKDRVRRDTILYFYKQSAQLGLELKDTLAVAEAFLRLGTFLTAQKDQQSVAYLKKAWALFVRKNKEGSQLFAMLHLAGAYIALDQFGEAWSMLDRSERFCALKKLDEYDMRLLMDSQFVRYFEKTGQWKKAYERLKSLSELEKRQLLSDYDGTVTRLNIKYETSKKEALLKAQQKSIALNDQNLLLQKRFSIVASVLFAMATGMSIVFFRLSRKNQRISRRNEELVKEQNHRVKNNLQVVASLLSLQAKQLTDGAAKEAIVETRLRVESMAILHRRLYDGNQLAEVNLDAFIRELVQMVLKNYGYAHLQPRFTLDPIRVSADKAVSVGLIINELTTNACKYAFIDNENPVLVISCLQKKDKLELSVADNGPGWPTTRPGREPYGMQKGSFGIQLIQSQVEQLYGTYRFQSANGVVFTMDFPA
ncbi:sensor histidine kinase [Spirosoma koreense]